MNQITIYELLPRLRKGWVAMDKDKIWWWYDKEPSQRTRSWWGNGNISYDLDLIFNIASFDGDWKDSLMECGQ